MSTAVVSGFSSSKVQQENRLKSRKQSRQSGLKPLNKQTGMSTTLLFKASKAKGCRMCTVKVTHGLLTVALEVGTLFQSSAWVQCDNVVAKCLPVSIYCTPRGRISWKLEAVHFYSAGDSKKSPW